MEHVWRPLPPSGHSFKASVLEQNALTTKSGDPSSPCWLFSPRNWEMRLGHGRVPEMSVCLVYLSVPTENAQSSRKDSCWVQPTKWILFKARDSLIRHLPSLTWLVLFCNLEKDVCTVVSELHIFLLVSKFLGTRPLPPSFGRVLFNNAVRWVLGLGSGFPFARWLILVAHFHVLSLPSFQCEGERTIVSTSQGCSGRVRWYYSGRNAWQNACNETLIEVVVINHCVAYNLWKEGLSRKKWHQVNEYISLPIQRYSGLGFICCGCLDLSEILTYRASAQN